MTVVIVLFFIGQSNAISQCKQQISLDQSVTIEGISNSIGHYYQNLIIQDVALNSRKAFDDISLRFDYQIQYVADYCKPGQFEIKVLPLSAKAYPLFYEGYDISNAVVPEKADLIFHLTHPDSYVSDSLIFFDIPINYDSSLYTSITTDRNELAADITITFSKAVFNYTKLSYEVFRDHILGIDHYFAASLIADSAKVWAEKGFLSDQGTMAELVIRQIELDRIMDYIRPQQFESFLFKVETDKLTSRYSQLQRINNRLKAIISYKHSCVGISQEIFDEKAMVNVYLNWLDHYYRVSFNSNFRYLNFIEGLAIPGFNNAELAKLNELFTHDYQVPAAKIQHWGSLLMQGLLDRGVLYENDGNQARALNYYRSAYDLSNRMHLRNYQPTAYQQVRRMNDSITASYLRISRKSALTENPKMAAKYYMQAIELLEGGSFKLNKPSFLTDYDRWLYQDFEDQAVKYIDLKNYKKAFTYLIEIELHCQSDFNYPCPELLYEWMRSTREGIYHELLQTAVNLLAMEDFQEAGQKYRQAISMRLGAGYRIDKDVAEAALAMRFRQIQYEELFEEGLRFYDKEKYSAALYFFNKAEYLSKSGVIHSIVELGGYRQDAARQVILANLSEGRVKVWAHDFESATIIVNLLKKLLSEYQISDSDSLMAQYVLLKEDARQKKCYNISNEYKELMTSADSVRIDQDYILAHRLVCEAVNLSMDNLNCKIRDDEAWYQKVVLEAPAEFQQMENDLKSLVSISSSEYVASFHELRTYYNRHKLLQQGITFTPLIDRVLYENDPDFLQGMLGFYIKTKDFDHAFRVLKRIKELKLPAIAYDLEQKKIAVLMAVRDTQDDTISEPWETLRSYIGRDKWYRTFRKSYRRTWLKETHWKLKYWPFIWKK